MKIWLECPNCGCRTKEANNYSDFEMRKTIEEACNYWIEMREKQMKIEIKSCDKFEEIEDEED